VPEEKVAEFFEAWEKYCEELKKSPELTKNDPGKAQELDTAEKQIPVRTMVPEGLRKQLGISDNAKLESARPGGVYQGPIIWTTDGLILQQQSANRVVAHKLKNFPEDKRASLQSLKSGTECSIRYSPQGQGSYQTNQPRREQGRDGRGR